MPEISEEELEKFKAAEQRATDLESSKKRLEDENAKYKTRAQDAEGKLSEAEKAKLEAEGNTQALLDAERAEKVKLQDKIATTNKATMREKLRNEVSKHAKDAHDVDMIIKVTEHKDLLKLDDEALTVDGVKEYVEKVRETHSYLFSKKRMDGGDNTPPSGGKKEFKTEDEKYLSELRACSSRQQMDAVRKKYGKQID
jgi:hypothetical protein